MFHFYVHLDALIQVDQCHDPPGIVIVMYNSFGQPVFNQSFYNGSTMVSDARLPLNLNVTVEQLPADAISVEVRYESKKLDRS